MITPPLFPVPMERLCEEDLALARTVSEWADRAVLADLARLVIESEGLRLRGVFTHGGQVYRARPDEVAAIGRAEGETMVRVAERLRGAGLGPVEVALGATPSIASSARVDGVQEIHPGVYVFGDRQQAALGAMPAETGVAFI